MVNVIVHTGLCTDLAFNSVVAKTPVGWARYAALEMFTGQGTQGPQAIARDDFAGCALEIVGDAYCFPHCVVRTGSIDYMVHVTILSSTDDTSILFQLAFEVPPVLFDQFGQQLAYGRSAAVLFSSSEGNRSKQIPRLPRNVNCRSDAFVFGEIFWKLRHMEKVYRNRFLPR
jgi:hypothetical protein